MNSAIDTVSSAAHCEVGAIRRTAYALVLFLALATDARADGQIAPVWPLDSTRVNLSGHEFWQHYSGPDSEMNKAARLYALGVLDATEGRSWCSYRLFKSVTLHEMLHAYFSRLSPQRLEARASKLIEDAISSRHPCKAAKP